MWIILLKGITTWLNNAISSFFIYFVDPLILRLLHTYIQAVIKLSAVI